MTADHDRAFFEQMATCRDAYRRLGDAIHFTLGPPSFGGNGVLDISAGLGAVAGRLAELGWAVAASDLYAPEDMRERERPTDIWLRNRIDLKVTPLHSVATLPSRYISQIFDLVICTETAEHIPAAFADAVVRNVAERATGAVIWSAAQPGQEWPGHVNVRPPAYWLARFAACGFEVAGMLTECLRAEMHMRRAQHYHAADNFFVLGRRS